MSTDPGPEPPAASARPPVLTRAQASLPGARRAVVIGAGSFGTAIAVLLARAGLRATLQTRSETQATELAEKRVNETYLPGIELPAALRIEPIYSGVTRADYVFLAVPSTSLAGVIAALPTAGLGRRAAVVSLSKGLVAP
ncbi:MAG TPA: 2-dehydropantoate 2-reductase N-terminal domain-containing protein, partial [Solirubrobacteraceae bacterium]|nr:2-dehydropantoate 2-reductase N-terminal domain-containing protein [Solirubrobacteraceae bacterium]